MPNDKIRISQLPAATSPTGNDVLAGVQDGVTKRFSLSVILAWLRTILTPAGIGAVPETRTVNGKALNQDITLTASNVAAVPAAEKGAVGGVATLDGDGKVPSSQLDLSGKQDEILASGILKGDGLGGVSAAAAGTDYGTYSKPSGGIPASDLAAGVIPSVPSAYTSSPAMDGTASPGSSGDWARGDHVHPADTSKQDKVTASGILKGDGQGGISAAVVGTDYQAPLTLDTTPTEDSTNPVTSDGIYDAVKARYTATTIYNTLTDVHTDTTITMDHSFTNYKFLMIVFNTQSPASSSKRIPLVVSTNALPQGGFYAIANPDAQGYVRLNYVSGQAKQLRVQATNFSALYIASVSGLT